MARQSYLRAISARTIVVTVLAAAALVSCSSGGATGPIPGVVADTSAPSTPSPVAQQATSDPSTVVTTFFSDLMRNDCVAAYGQVTDPLRTRVGGTGGLCSLTGTPQGFTVGGVTTLTPGAADVAVTVRTAGRQVAEQLTLLFQGMRWLISDLVGGSVSSPGGSPLSIDSITARIEEQYQAQGGASVVVTCSPAASAPLSPGDEFACTYSDASGRSGTISVTIDSAQGAFHWSVR